jgi:hypothetical protein
MLHHTEKMLGHTAATALASAILLTTLAAHSQTPPQNTTVNLNYVYAASLGFGGYSLAGLEANVYTLPLAQTLENVPANGWSLKLLLPIQLGFYNFKATLGGQHVDLNQQSISVVPGAELQIPVNDRFMIKPFAQFGAVHAFGVGGQNPDAYVYLAGARSVAQWQVNDYTLSLGNGIVYAGDNTIGSGFAEHYVSLQLAGEVRRPLNFKIGEWTPDLGLYAADYFYPAPLVFSRFLRSPLKVHNQNEIGFSIGAAESFKFLWFSNPRIGAGFVFGGGLNVYHVNFGFPF